MTDEELTAFAAKAYGDPPAGFSPLTDDGDALRLAVKLGMIVEAGANRTIVFHPGADESVTKALEWYENSDPYAATRRAIVRAAAAIGKEQSNG